MIKVSDKRSHLTKKNSSIKKIPMNKVESQVKFWPKLCETVLTQSHSIWNFNVGRVSTKDLFAQTTLDVIFGTK